MIAILQPSYIKYPYNTYVYHKYSNNNNPNYVLSYNNTIYKC